MDYKIIKSILSGDVNKFDSLIEKYYKELFKFVYNQLNDVETTKNVVQDIFMKIYSNLKKYNPNKASFRTRMYRIANHICLNYLRDNLNNKTFVLDETLHSTNESIIEELMLKDDVSYILKLMQKKLSKRNYKIITLNYFSNLTHKEIAETFNLSPKTIRNIVSDSIKKIRDLVRSEQNVRN